jgi:hypothetical protein
MKSTLLSYITLAGISSLMLTSCIKDDVTDTTDHGSTFIKVLEAPEKKLFFSPFSDVKTVSLFSLRKDANSNAKLNEAAAVKLTPASDLITAYNTAHGDSYEVLPDSLYTLDAGNPKVGGIYQMNLAGGEFARDFVIKLNGAKWDISHKYALGFKITDPAGHPISDGKGEILALISVKNKWDGVYAINGTFSDATNAAFTGAYPLVWELQTTSPTQCVVADMVELGFPGFLFYTGTGYSYYGSFGLVVNFDPATDQITSVTNYYGQPAGNTRSAELDPSGINAYDAATKTINIKYYMKQPSVVPAAPNIRAFFDEEWKYTGPRQ